MLDPLRQDIAATADTVVVKVGTRVLTHDDGTLDLGQIESLSGQLARLCDTGRRVVLVSSGAVGAGIGRLKLARRPTHLAGLQAAAAVGQSRLIEAYNQALERHGRHAAQVLLTIDDLNDRKRYLNVRNTLAALFEFGAVPVVNENDTVRVTELRRNVGDNDRLAAVVTNLLRAPLLVLLSDVEGLYDRPPSEPGATLLSVVHQVDDRVLALAGVGPQGPVRLSTGGMASKLQAARIATNAGENVVIANGRRAGVLDDLVAGAPVGTLFLAQGRSVSSRKRWIGWTAQPQGTLTIDEGARRALVEKGGSLLAVGVVEIDGSFEKGDLVAIRTQGSPEVARGLTNYGSKDLALIRGQPTDRFAELLGRSPYQEVIHRDNLALLD